MPASDTNYIELVRWGISIGIPAVSGLGGVMLGAWLSGRRETRQRQLTFVERQLLDFYSPLLGIRSEIRMRSELRVRVHNTADAEWRRLCEEKKLIGVEALQKLTDERGKEFTEIIEYDNRQLKEELIPAYRKMVNLFRDNMWLAEAETKEYFRPLLEFVELWERWLAKTLPSEVIQSLEHGEESLHPFYDHLQNKHDELREKLERGHV
jgi:hypothetical protein